MSFQTLHDHMIIIGTRGYKTGKSIKKNLKFVYNFEYSVHIAGI